jgi:hypothetical protein
LGSSVTFTLAQAFQNADLPSLFRLQNVRNAGVTLLPGGQKVGVRSFMVVQNILRAIF